MLNVVNMGELGEGPASVLAQGVDAGQPVGFHRVVLLPYVFTPVALDFHDEVQRTVLTVVHLNDEVGDIGAGS